MFQKIFIALILLLGAALTTACGETETGSALAIEGSYEVDPRFREFYELLGGSKILGVAISPVFEENGTSIQYTEAVLMVHDLQTSAGQKYRLAPLGDKFVASETKTEPPADGKGRTLDGHTISSEFEPIFDQMGGAPIVGAPLTEVQHNREKGRVEQYFENVGFYRLEGEAPGVVHLLPYGAWECSSSCRDPGPLNSTIEVQPQAAPQFDRAVLQMGHEFTGLPLSDVYTAWDGQVEQIFENVVVVSNAQGQVNLRAMLEIIGIYPEPMAVANPDPLMYFFSLQGEQGYNVPRFFLEYINRHGGFELTGPPISELNHYSEQVYRQCYQRMCLDYDQMLPSPVRPAPLGYLYRQLTQPGTGYPEAPQVEAPAPLAPEPQIESPAEIPQSSEGQAGVQPTLLPAEDVEVAPQATENIQQNQEPASPGPNAGSPQLPGNMDDLPEIHSTNELSFQVWEVYPMVSSSQGQDVGVGIMVNAVPIADLTPELIVTLPDGSQQPFTFPPTGVDGQAHLILPPIQASNGTLVPYQVCLTTRENSKVCVKDSYLIWNP